MNTNETIMNEVASEYQATFNQPSVVPCDGDGYSNGPVTYSDHVTVGVDLAKENNGYSYGAAGLSKEDYADRKHRNSEYYKDPTYHGAKHRDNGYFKRPKNNSAPVYFSSRSRRYELIGVITRICDLAGFELAERIVLRDKETGEVLR